MTPLQKFLSQIRAAMPPNVIPVIEDGEYVRLSRLDYDGLYHIATVFQAIMGEPSLRPRLLELAREACPYLDIEKP